ncbi:hypothetical protein HN51_014262 [Arachis hypogaea]|uniref:Uncharacterized protein n=2 Tax=Arachis hypogaea TaxID=3818 RepID=A0A445CQ07_ARAHY|nr:cation/H(+) antiporter 20 [Arachis hypogaea]QHO45820.1 Cation/H(+) antiporter [Arachis hypogaea]RYR53007.1 hypothetical protein Ahy_A06g027854 [Arachis hypogaea]
MKLKMANITTIKTSSDGAWQGDNPLNYAIPLLIIQTVLVLSVSRSLTFLLKPLRQPKVVAEILGGILLGPSGIGRNKQFTKLVFPSWSTPILESVASIGLLFFLFLVGIELDIRTIRRSGKRAFSIAVAGISLPFLFAMGVTFLLQKAIHFGTGHNYLQLLMFMGVSLSITAFPVLARILAELKLLTTQVGETAMAAAAFNDVAAWVLLALAIALADGQHKSSPLTSIWVLISGVAFVAFVLVLVRPFMNWVARQWSRQRQVFDEATICLTLAGVMIAGFVTDLIGIHSIFGAFVFGITIPKKGEFASSVAKRIEDFVTVLLLPLYFASSGLKTDVAKLHGMEEWGLLVLVIVMACVGKILGTFTVAMMSMIPVRESLTLGFLMNTKGLVELIVLNIGKEKKVLNDEVFAILVLMALFTTFITTPIVLAIYPPSRPSKQNRAGPRDDLSILACVHDHHTCNIPSLISFIESIRPNTTTTTNLKLYVMKLVELTDRSTSILTVQRSRRNGFPEGSESSMHDQVVAAFKAYHGVGQVRLRHLRSVSALSTMHEDICHVAEKHGVGMIIIPFHKRWRRGEQDEDDEEAIEIGQGWREVNQTVLQTAPCAVAVLVNRGVGTWLQPGATDATMRVCIVFIGGLDDRMALDLGARMAQHPAITLSLVRFMSTEDWETDKELDEVAVNEFKAKLESSVTYIEKDASSITEEVLRIGKSKEYELLIVGKGNQLPESSMEDSRLEHAELGHMGNLLTSSAMGITSSVLVIQDQQLVTSNETELRKMASVL